MAAADQRGAAGSLIVASFRRLRDSLDLGVLPPHHPGMHRRRFLLTSLAGALATPLAAEAQQTFSGSCQAIFP
jgi:hypothetical protein